MSKFTILIIGDHKKDHRQFSLPILSVRALYGAFFLLTGFLTYIALDYIELIELRKTYRDVISENRNLKGEARILMSNLEEAKDALNRVEDYASRLNELVSLKVKTLSKKTGLKNIAKNNDVQNIKKSPNVDAITTQLPLGVSASKLEFKPVLKNIEAVNAMATAQAINLQNVLSTLQKRSHLLSTIPMAKPVRGWYASGFGYRTSPFSGKRTMHRGLDIAAPVGTPIYAPADGVVIFSGNKSGYGKFIMVAHGHGIVTRYGHNAQLMVKAGERIKRGDQIATVGMTGRTTGPHLHYEVWVNGRPTNPSNFILSTSLALN